MKLKAKKQTRREIIEELTNKLMEAVNNDNLSAAFEHVCDVLIEIEDAQKDKAKCKRS